MAKMISYPWGIAFDQLRWRYEVHSDAALQGILGGAALRYQVSALRYGWAAESVAQGFDGALAVDLGLSPTDATKKHTALISATGIMLHMNSNGAADCSRFSTRVILVEFEFLASFQITIVLSEASFFPGW